MHLRPQDVAPRPIAVERDSEGLRLALLELMEESFQQGKVERAGGQGMSEDRLKEHLASLPVRRTLSPGYYTFALHILRLDAERAAGVPLDARYVAAYEGAALRTLAACRNEHRAKHPPCSRCGAEQESRYHPECTGCGAKFARKGVR